MWIINVDTKRVGWEQINGEKFEGTLTEIDNGTAIVKMDDGTKKAVCIE
jgi:hypothetical protein